MTGIAEWGSRLRPVEPNTASARRLRPRLPTTSSCASDEQLRSALLGLFDSTTSVTSTSG